MPLRVWPSNEIVPAAGSRTLEIDSSLVEQDSESRIALSQAERLSNLRLSFDVAVEDLPEAEATQVPVPEWARAVLALMLAAVLVAGSARLRRR